MENDKLQRNFYLSRLIIEELSGKISDERRRELLGENFIYHDMVRTGRAVERLGIQKFQLLLPIPGKELQLNPLLGPNPGY